jgi:hypothetical protein
LLQLKYSDFYSQTDNIIPAAEVITSTGIPLTALMIQTFCGVCSTAKTKFKKKSIDRQKSEEIRTFICRYKKRSRHLRKVLSYSIPVEIPHNIVKFANNMDIVINESQSKTLNGLWTNNFFDNQTKTFIFKLHNNTLGYNATVAHFVRGHSPNCTFCDLARDQNINAENGLHLFLECEHVEGTVNYVMEKFTREVGFEYSRREFFATFERRNYSCAKNFLLTFFSKLVMKVIWDFRNHYSHLDRTKCWSVLSEELVTLKHSNKKFETLLNIAGFNIENP